MARKKAEESPTTTTESPRPKRSSKGAEVVPPVVKPKKSDVTAKVPKFEEPKGPSKKKTLLQEVEEERATLAASAKFRRRQPKLVEEVAEFVPVVALAANVPKERPSKRKESAIAPVEPVRSSSKPSRVRPVAASPQQFESVESLPVPTWRKPEPNRPKPQDAETEQSSEPISAEGLSPRRTRTRKHKDRKDIEISAGAALKETVTPVPPQERPKRGQQRQAPKAEVPKQPAPLVIEEAPLRPPVPVPEDAARVVMRGGVPTLVKGHKVLPPLFFFASAQDENQLAIVLEEVKQAADHGIHLFSVLVELEVDEASVDDAVSFAGYLAKQIKAVDSEAQIVLRTVFVAPPGWEKRFPQAAFLAESGILADPSLCDDEFWSLAETCLNRYIQKLRKLDRDGTIIGVHLERGEWFYADGTGFDISDAAKAKFRDWLRHRYRGDTVSLRASWFDGNVDFSNVNVPEYREVRKEGKDFVRTDRKARRWVDYHLFLSDSTCERIATLAYAAKEASEGHYLVGASYGYTFEWSHPASGHLSLGKLLRSPDIDYIGGPPSYRNREPGGSCPFPAPIDSFALNGKLYVSEEDFKTPISGQREPDDFNPVMKTPQALGSVHWRGAGSALAHGTGVCWMDSWGNGWLNSNGIWERAERAKEAMTWRLGTEMNAPDVAVLIDERSLAYLVDERAFEVLVQNVRESVLRAGLSAGFYLLSDLAHRENFPESKLYIFVNAWDIRPEVRSAIKTRLQRDDKVLFWLYSAGLFEGGRDSLERVREVTGIALRPQPFYSRPGTTILNSREPLCQYLPEQALSKGGQLEPSYFAIPEDGAVLGEYSHTGLPSFVERTFESEVSGKWHSVFLGEPIVTPGLFRSLAQKAHAHVWSFQNDVVHVNAPFLTVHCTGTSPRTLALPDKFTAFNIVENEWAQTDGNSLRFQGLDGSTHTFLIGTKAEIEAILAGDPDEILKIDELAPREENTMHWDEMRFDVPIMKLDEWVEESWTEEMADDLLIKPSMIELIDESATVEAEEPQRSRGRRRFKRRDSGNDSRGGKQDRGDDMTVNVMFRKRE